jgi:predicted MPP superfamily phosphohydrolase
MILIRSFFDILPFPAFVVPIVLTILLPLFIYRVYGLSGVPEWLRWAVALLAFVCSLADWAAFAFLPRLGLSFGPVESSWLTFTLFRLLLFLIPALIFRLILRRKGRIRTENVAVVIGILWVVNLVSMPYEYRSMYVEPFDLQVSSVPINVPEIASDRPLQIVHLSDLHIERITQRERDLIVQVNALHPDLIVLTGDYINIDYKADPEAQEATREVLSQLQAPLGVFAVSGSADVDSPEVVETILPKLDNITYLDDEAVYMAWEGIPIIIIGMSVEHEGRLAERLQGLFERTMSEEYSILLYHEPSPEMVEAASETGINLFLAGHTHGGQIRLPLIGAPMSLHPDYYPENDRGLYQVGPTTIYVSSGIGMEGLSMPRFRFNVPPEIVFLQLGALE